MKRIAALMAVLLPVPAHAQLASYCADVRSNANASVYSACFDVTDYAWGYTNGSLSGLQMSPGILSPEPNDIFLVAWIGTWRGSLFDALAAGTETWAEAYSNWWPQYGPGSGALIPLEPSSCEWCGAPKATLDHRWVLGWGPTVPWASPEWAEWTGRENDLALAVLDRTEGFHVDSYQGSVESFVATPVSVPEPPVWALLAVGLLLLGVRRQHESSSVH